MKPTRPEHNPLPGEAQLLRTAEQLEVMPHPDSLSRLEQMLDRTSRKRQRMHWPALAASLAFLLMVAGTLFIRPISERDRVATSSLPMEELPSVYFASWLHTAHRIQGYQPVSEGNGWTESAHLWLETPGMGGDSTTPH